MTAVIEVESMVCQKLGGPMMLVMEVYESAHGAGLVARCAWFDRQRIDEATIPIDQLDLMSVP